jgi:MraZ protein
MAIPSRHRDRILARSDGMLIVTVDRDYCLLLYPLPDWEETERKLIRLPSLNDTARKLQRLMLGYATELEMDNQGRILLPREHREFAGLEKQAMLIGQGNKFELWDEQRWNERRDEWLAGDDSDFKDLPEELEKLSL